MSQRSFITNITPLPSTISRQTAIAQLHDHHAMIELNPLVLRHERTNPPPNASQDEAESGTWYEITDSITYLPGVKGQVSYKAMFYDLPVGLQTHVFAPAGVEIRSKWSVGGNMPGEPKEPKELGVKTPSEGLYIREELDLRCNVFMSNFVKRNLKKSHLVVVDKIVARADMMGDREVRSNRSLSDRRRASLPLDRHTAINRAPSTISQLTELTLGRSISQQEEIVHYSYPPHCACEGTTHNPACSFFHPDDLNHQDIYFSGIQRQPKPYYAISLPSAASYSQPSSTGQSLEFGATCSELYGSPSPGSCLCAGGLHDEGCHLYPGLRLPQFTPFSLSATPVVNVEQSVAPPQPSTSAYRTSAGQRFIAQRPGEQAELAAYPRTPLYRYWPERGLIPDPLRSHESSRPASRDAGRNKLAQCG